MDTLDQQRHRIVESLYRLCLYGADVHAPDPILDAMVRLIKSSERQYDESNVGMEWTQDNLRYNESLLGERNMFAYIMHVYSTMPAWVWVELLDSKQDQYVFARDILLHGITDHPKSVQCKTGHLGKNGDLYVHKDWITGSPDDIVAVCIERGVVYGGSFDVWKTVYKEGASAINDEAKWMYASEFKERGGWVTEIHKAVNQII